MMQPFSTSHLERGKALLKSGKVNQVLFSEGTYQVEVGELWPFLQLDAFGNIIDCFCSCQEAEKKRSCPHLAAAYLKIVNATLVPLHVRFRASLWNFLCQMASRRHGYSSSVVQEKKQGFEISSTTHKLLFSIKAKTPEAKKRLREMLFERTEETEETSLKFSNLSPQELSAYRAGNPSHLLQYELSFWSDLAKWMMAMQEEKVAYVLRFDRTDQLPKWVIVEFRDLEVQFYIAEANWPYLIPALATVESPLVAHHFESHKIEEIFYDEKRRLFLIKKEKLKAVQEKREEEEGVEVGEWVFLPEKGFFPKKSDPLFKRDEIPEEKIGQLLQRHSLVIQKYLKNAEVHSNQMKVRYALHFDAEKQLHIACYLFEKGDLQKKDSGYFGRWVYLHGKGFYPIEAPVFDRAEVIVPKESLSDFINHHRVFLGEFEGFQTHVSTVESQMSFSLSKEGTLSFEASIALLDVGEEVTDFGEWVYLKDRGFFAKELGKGILSIRPNERIPAAQVSPFIHKHAQELEVIKGFFAARCPLEKSGLEIFLDEEEQIVVRPHFRYFPSYGPENVRIFGEYTYVEKEGFFEIPHEKRVPEPYTIEQRISKEKEPYFVLYELEALSPFILNIQKELQHPQELFLKVERLQRRGKERPADWLLEGFFESELGRVDVFTVWQALAQNQRYLFSNAGLIYLKHPRFNWLKSIQKRKWLKKGTLLRLSTLEWLKVTVFETVRPPTGNAIQQRRTRQLMEELSSFHVEKAVDLSGFKSALRSYQEAGVKWLFFLYMHGLSGMLCDEMGLGKTHQAMGLIAAAKNVGEKKAKILVVCPTSVIYHWEELLKRFLPEVKTFVFYGILRKLEPFAEHYDLLLTSYGTLRSESEALSKISFEIAIFDELQIAKNAQSQTHKALKKISAFMRLGLTGTPIENRLLELKALFDVVLPGYFPQEAHFKEFFVNPIEKGHDVEKKALLSKLVSPFMLRRKKKEVLLELPEKIEEVAYCDLSDEQKELYKKSYLGQKQTLLQELEDPKKSASLLHVFSLLSTLKQICDHPCLITKKYDNFEEHRSGKWDLFVELLDEIRDSGQKVVVFSQYLDMLDMMQKYLERRGIGYATIRGATRDRKEQLTKFREDPTCEVFLASLQAVGVGVDLVAASVVIHYDRWWNPARENQATDRVHRIGQNRGVQVFKLVTKSTIEEHIHELIQKKVHLTEGVLSFDEQDQVKGLDREEVLRLLWLIDKDLELG